MDRALESYITHYYLAAHELCGRLEEPTLQYLCRRVKLRPHMLRFMSRRGLVIPEKLTLGQCSAVDDWESAYCSFLHAAHLSLESTRDAHSFCQGLGDDTLIGECQFFIGMAKIRDLEGNPELPLH